MPIPPDNRTIGDGGHIDDHNNIADELTALVADTLAAQESANLRPRQRVHRPDEPRSHRRYAGHVARSTRRGAAAAVAAARPQLSASSGWSSRRPHSAAAIGNSTLAAPVNHVHAQGCFGGTFGDGSDGAVTLDGTTTISGFGAPSSSIYTLSRDVYCASLAINSGVTVKPAGYRIFVNGAITGTGTISNNGEQRQRRRPPGAAPGPRC